MKRLLEIARVQWFLLGLAILIPLGFSLGRLFGSAGGDGSAASKPLGGREHKGPSESSVLSVAQQL